MSQSGPWGDDEGGADNAARVCRRQLCFFSAVLPEASLQLLPITPGMPPGVRCRERGCTLITARPLAAAACELLARHSDPSLTLWSPPNRPVRLSVCDCSCCTLSQGVCQHVWQGVGVPGWGSLWGHGARLIGQICIPALPVSPVTVLADLSNRSTQLGLNALAKTKILSVSAKPGVCDLLAPSLQNNLSPSQLDI